MKRLGIIAAAAAAWPCAVYANAGAGFLMLSIPMLMIGLVPIIVVETPFIARLLGLGFRRSLWVSSCANLASTIAGAVIAIGLDFAMIAGGSSGLEPSKAVMLLSLLPMFFVTWWLEARVVRKMEPRSTGARRATLVANLASYALLAGSVVALAPGVDRVAARRQMTDVVNRMVLARIEVAEHFASNGSWPPPARLDTGMPQLSALVRRADGSVVGTLFMPEVDELHRKTLVLTPSVEGGKITGWKCHSPDGAAPKYLPYICRDADASR